MKTLLQIADEIVNDLPLEDKVSIFSKYEMKRLTALTEKFGQVFGGGRTYFEMMAEGLYRYKKLYTHYLELYHSYDELPAAVEEPHLRKIMEPVVLKFHRDGRRAFTGLNYFNNLSWIGNFSTKAHISNTFRKEILGWVLDFPIIPANSCADIILCEIFPYNFPHTYIKALGGALHDCFNQKKSEQETRRDYYSFVNDGMRMKKRHDLWYYRNRLPGSYESGQRR